MAVYVPETGLSLWRGDQPGSTSPDPHAKQTQIMRLSLAQNTLDELVDTLRSDQKARLRLGKHQTLFYGSKSQQFHSRLEPHRSELYRTSSSDRENLYFSGVLSHSLEVQKAKEATAATDEALANLEQSLNAFERGKESKKTQLVNLKPDDRRSRSRAPLSKTDLDKERFFKNHSLAGSPSLSAVRSPASLPALTPVSAPSSQNKRKIRLEALKTPFIHLLAVTPVSVKYLAQTTRSSQEDCLELAKKYGVENRIDPSKFNLKDKSFKELDIWNFPYPSESDRTSAIENAISAFDRQRISPSDKLWQILNSKEERAKGICKSRLKLQTGAQPPPIKVHASEEAGKEGDMAGNETDHTNGRLTPNAMQADNTSTKPTSKKAATNKPRNSTLTGRVTKKAEKKAPAKSLGKFKSAEFVLDSDEDTDIPDAPPARAPVSTTSVPAPSAPSRVHSPPTATKKLPNSAEAKKTTPKPLPDGKKNSRTTSAAHSPVVKPQITLKPQPRNLKTIPANTNGTASKTLPGPRTTKPVSPVKPSPLASSPPTNASDFDNSSQNSGQSSSSSSSPLMAQMVKQAKAKPAVTAKPKADVKPGVKPNGTVKSMVEPTIPLKRKAAPEPMPATSRFNNRPNDDIKRRRPMESMSPSGTSSGSASPPLSREHLRQKLRQKSMDFKKLYSIYRTLHDSLVNQMAPTPSDLSRLKQMHTKVQRMKKEIWDEDRRLRG